MFKKIVLRKEASDAAVVKIIQFDQVKTQNIVDGKIGFTDTKDIKRLGYDSTDEYIQHLKADGYAIQE